LRLSAQETSSAARTAKARRKISTNAHTGEQRVLPAAAAIARRPTCSELVAAIDDLSTDTLLARYP